VELPESSSARANVRRIGAQPGSKSCLLDSTGTQEGDHSELMNQRKRIVLKQAMQLVLVISAAVLLAHDNNPSSGANRDSSEHAKGQTTVQGCVGRSNGDYILVKQDPAVTYELRSSGKTKLGHYLGQQVEVTGRKSASLSTSSDFLAGRVPSPVTITVTSIKTITKECTEQLDK
jgi:hypothetical protein